MNSYIIQEYGIDESGHKYVAGSVENNNEVYEGDYHDCDNCNNSIINSRTYYS